MAWRSSNIVVVDTKHSHACQADVKYFILIDMNKEKVVHARRKTGRPLSFDRDEALHQAMLVFWKQGYEATSLTDLTQAMGVTAPSIYTAFGDKKRLFLEAVDLYVGKPMFAEVLIEDASSAADAAKALLGASAVAYTGKKTPAGCLLAGAAIACSTEAEDVRAALAAIRLRVEAKLKKKIAEGIAKGELARDTNPGALSAVTMAVIQGMATLARDGANRKKLMEVAEMAMDVWPEGEK